MPKLTEQQIAEAKEAFALFDKDNDGCITTAELGTVLRALGRNPTEAEVAAAAREADADGRGLVTFADFQTALGRDMRGFDSEGDLRAAWEVFDKDCQGWIAVSELRHVLTNIGEKLSPQEMDALVAEADTKGDGRVEREAFVRLLMAK